MKNILLPIDYKGMTGIVPPLKPYNQISPGRQKINYFAFPLITPLRSNNHGIGHHFSPMDILNIDNWFKVQWFTPALARLDMRS
jgi:hypothetical protein